MRELRAIAVALMALASTACPGANVSGEAIPRPDVHLTAEFVSTDSEGCCVIYMTNPTSDELYALCDLTIYNPTGEIRFQAYIGWDAGGIHALPGRHRTGCCRIDELDPHADRYEFTCRAVSYPGTPPV